MRLQLRPASFERRQRAHGDEFALRVGQVVACEDVAEEVRLKVIVGSGGESVVERASRQFRLHLGALPQRVVALGQRVGVAALGVVDAAPLAPVEHALQRGEGVKAARETRVGVKLRQCFLYLADGQSRVESAAYGAGQTLYVALGLKA